MRTQNLISLLLVALLQCHLGYAINCNFCIGDCKSVTVKSCAAEEVCMIREMYADGVRSGQQKGCLNAQMCNNTSAVETFKQWCCNTDLCNTEIPQPGGAGPAYQPGVPPAGSPPDSRPSTLTCHSCGYICMDSKTVVCAAGELCVTKSTKVAFAPMKRYGCAKADICSTNTTEDVGGTMASVHNKCCSTDLCNSSAALRPALLSAIGALLLLWIVKLS